MSGREGSPGSSAADAGAAAARARAGALLDAAAHVQLDVVVIAPPDAARSAARERARVAANASGRGRLLDDALVAARERVNRAFAAGGYSGTWAATDMAVSAVRGPDRAAAAAALEEAMTAAVTEDIVDPETIGVLNASWAELTALRTMPQPGSLSNFGRSMASLRGIRGASVLGLIAIAIVAALSTGVTALGLGFLAVALLIAGLAIAGGRNAEPP